ncbi:endoribonuclease Dicer [Anopheles nili]|uniref:endoribonuclease Dicer n=1 Tax=Anopheles nili TaxID=185578 RepID=UPI00237BA116|nr:endoribonuclease Dicer [Anopheles nili]
MSVNNKPFAEDFSPRNYQVQMKNVCLNQNTIVYLPTGSGKTFIALMVMKELSYQLQNVIDHGGKRMFFLANTVALAKQQAHFFSQHMPFSVRLYTSEINVDTWKSDRWLKELSEVQVLVCTSQILLDVLHHGYITPSNINLIVFDECHRAVGQHPMHAIMKEIIAVPKTERPRIIGLSGTLLFKELKLASQVTDELERLENTFSSTIATVTSYDEYSNVAAVSTCAQEAVCPYFASSVATSPIVQQIIAKMKEFSEDLAIVHLPEYKTQCAKTLQQSLSKPLKEVNKALTEFTYQMMELGIYAGSLAILAAIVQLEIAKRSASCDKGRQVFRGAITFCEWIRHVLVDAMAGFSEKEKILNFSTDRMLKLLKYLEDSYSKIQDQEKQALIFVERRFSAKVLYHLIKIYFQCQLEPDELTEPIVKPDFVVGINRRLVETIDDILIVQQERRVLDRFRKHKINVMCATNVIEEGIDLQMCNMVIMFDPPKSYVSYMQSKGRARSKTSTYLMMMPNEDRVKFLTRLKLYRAIDDVLKKELIGKTINRPEPLEKDVQNELLNDIIPPFFTPLNAKLDAVGSIQLLNRYCMSMPRDLFTDSNVTWNRISSSDQKHQVSIKLPMQSTVRETVYGVPFQNMKLAKQSAAFNACKLLYEAGELSMHLLPVTKNDKVEELSEQYFKHWRKLSNEPNPKLAGTMKNVRGYKVCYPKETMGCTPQADGVDCYVYVIRVRAQFDATIHIDNARIFSELYSSSSNFGILTCKELPPLARMKFFVTLGMIGVDVMREPIRVTLPPDSGQLRQLKRFHMLLFRDLLKVWKPFTVLDAAPEENGMLIVPLLHSKEIDWALINRFPYLRPAEEASTRVRQQMQFDANRYQYCVVHPWYKNDPNQYYVVVRVHEDLRPTSPFPNAKYASFEQYFQTEHHQVIMRRDDQFLIEVKGIPASLNRLHPGGEADGGATTRSRYWEFQEILIPELVHNFEFPADYWLKATLLPSILHRVHYLLLAENIRMDLAVNARIGLVKCDQVAELQVDQLLSPASHKLLPPGQDLYDDNDDEDDSDEMDSDDPGNGREPNHLGGMQLQNVLEKIHTESSAIVDQITYPWEEREQPLDYDRNWDKVAKIDLDYYCSFITKYSEQASVIASDNSRAVTESNLDCVLAELDISGDDAKDKSDDETRLYQRAAIEDGMGRPGEIHMLKLTPENTANVCLQQADLLQALTTKSSGDVYNLERFEVLGDAFLKFAVSVYVLFKHPSWHEGYLTSCKGRMVSNRNLLYCAMSYGLPGKIKAHTFDPKNDWVPPLSIVPAPIGRAMVEAKESPALLFKLELSEEEIQSGMVSQATIDKFLPLIEKNETASRSTLQSVLQQVQIADKVVADATEALIGVCVKTVGYERSFRFLTHLSVLPKGVDVPLMLRTSQFSVADYFQFRTEIDRLLCNPNRIEKLLGYNFRNRTLLLQAFTHASYMSHSITSSYQQLEFLGDAVLDFLVTMYIYERNPNMSPGQLTDLRSALVNNVNLACVLVRNGLHRFILSQSPTLTDTIGKFVEVQSRKSNKIGDWVRLLTTESDTPMVEYVDVPKVLGDVFESLIGAIYLDSGRDLLVTWQVCYRLLRNEITNFSIDTPIQVVRQLYEHPEAEPHFSAPYVEDDVVIVKLSYTHRCQRQVVYGCGQNKEDARRAAAKTALSKLKQS